MTSDNYIMIIFCQRQIKIFLLIGKLLFEWLGYTRKLQNYHKMQSFIYESQKFLFYAEILSQI